MELRKLLPMLGLLGLLLLDMALITWALWPSSAVTSSAAPSVQVTTPDSSESTQRPDVADEIVDPSPLVRLIAATSQTTAWLADGGSCESPGRVHVTVTGGDEWSTQPAPGSVTRVRPDDGNAAFVVGGGPDCEARVWYTGNRGEEWGSPQSAAQAWGRDPNNPQLSLRPGGEPVESCLAGDVLDLVGLTGGAAAALCSDGSVRTTADRGASWTTTDSRQGLLAVSMIALAEGAAAGIEESCSGIAVSPIADGTLGESACVEDVEGKPGQVAISVTDGAVWLVAGDDVLRADSVDGPFATVSVWPGT